MQRRHYLASLGVIATLSGCTGSGGDQGDQGATRAVDGVELAVEDVASGVAVETEELLEPTRSGYVALLVHLDGEVIDDQSSSLAIDDEVAVVAGGSQESARLPEEGRFLHPVDGPAYDGPTNARPGVTASGWLVFPVERDVVDDARLSWERGGEDTLEWDLGVDAEQLPDFEVTDVKIPEETELHSSATVTVEVRNVGGSRGRFVDRVTVDESEQRNTYNDETDQEYVLDVDVEPGESESASATVVQPTNFDEPVRESTIGVAGRSQTVVWAVPVRRVGDFYALPGGLEVAVTEWRRVERATREGGWTGEFEYTPDDGRQLLFVQLRARNNDDQPRRPMRADQLHLRDASGDEVDTTTHFPSLSSSREWIDPDVDVYESGDLDPGRETSGWALFGVSDRLDLRNCRLRWERSSFIRDHDAGEPHEVAAEWRL